jgi:hypothetical protein
MIHLLRPRTVIALMLVLILSVAVYGFAAANTVPASTAGDGEGTISGYAISGIAYTLNGTNPGNVDAVTFTINPAAAGTVRVKLVAAGTTWYNCTNTGGAVSCATTGATAASADQLRVVATN